MTEATALSAISSTAREWRNRLRLPPKGESMAQDAEWCEIREAGGWRRMRFHDYADIYERPGLYEYLFYDLLACQSPRRVVGLLAEVRAELPQNEPLRVIDFGAGNGLVGKELRRIGAVEVVGVDILPEARAAARRDLPGAYSDYLVADMTRPDEDLDRRLRALRPNALTCVAALGFGDIPPAAFANAYNLVEDGGWLAFNIKQDFLTGDDRSGFQELIATIIEDGTMSVHVQTRYRHRNATNGDPIYYVALIGRKNREIPEHLYD